MVKVITLLKRKDGLTREEFSRYWEDKHGPLVVKLLPRMSRYVQNHAMTLTGGGEPQIDGVAELWFDDVESFQAAGDFLKSDEGKVIRHDEEQFIDRSNMVFFIAEEKVIKQ